MTATGWDLAATTSVKNHSPAMLARQLRALLQARVTQRLPITYQEAAKGLLLASPNTSHQITTALEQLMAEDAAAGRPFIAAMVISKARGADASPARQRGRTPACFMRSNSPRCSSHHPQGPQT